MCVHLSRRNRVLVHRFFAVHQGVTAPLSTRRTRVDFRTQQRQIGSRLPAAWGLHTRIVAEFYGQLTRRHHFGLPDYLFTFSCCCRGNRSDGDAGDYCGADVAPQQPKERGITNTTCTDRPQKYTRSQSMSHPSTRQLRPHDNHGTTGGDISITLPRKATENSAHRRRVSEKTVTTDGACSFLRPPMDSSSPIEPALVHPQSHHRHSSASCA